MKKIIFILIVLLMLIGCEVYEYEFIYITVKVTSKTIIEENQGWNSYTYYMTGCFNKEFGKIIIADDYNLYMYTEIGQLYKIKLRISRPELHRYKRRTRYTIIPTQQNLRNAVESNVIINGVISNYTFNQIGE